MSPTIASSELLAMNTGSGGVFPELTKIRSGIRD